MRTPFGLVANAGLSALIHCGLFALEALYVEKSYLKVTFRNLYRHKMYSFINIFGLATGIACFLLMGMFVLDEVSYDRYHSKAGRLYRIAGEINWSGGIENAASVQFPLATALMNDFPQIEMAARLWRPRRPTTIRFEDRQYLEEGLFFADPELLQMFDFTILAGDRNSALAGVNALVLTRQIAEKYFGDANPLGKLVTVDNDQALEVTAVIEKLPSNSHLQFDMLVPLELMPQLPQLEQNWYWNAFWTYVLLPKHQPTEVLERQFEAFVLKYFPESVREGIRLYLQPLTDIHLRSQLANEIDSNGNVFTVSLFAAIGLLVLFIACINFMNLATARSAVRAKEVGVRKVLGAFRGNLVRQFLGESMVMTAIAALLALTITQIFLPYFNDLTQKQLSLQMLDWRTAGVVLFVILIVGGLAGSYPALILSTLQPVRVLKGMLSRGRSGLRFRRLLVVTQFTVSIILLISIGVMLDQLDYISNKALGFDREQTILVRSRPSVSRQYEAFKNELLSLPEVTEVTRAAGCIPGEPTWTYRFLPEGWPREKPKAMAILYADYDFVETLNLSLVAGRGFSKVFPSDLEAGFLLNETAVKELGWTEDPIGKKIEYYGAGSDEIEKAGQVVGVVRDFHFESLYKPVEPLVITVAWPNMGNVLIKLHSESLISTLESIEQLWLSFTPDWPLDFSFLDDNIDAMYHKELRLSRTVKYFTSLAIFIACLGLFGLASFTAERRTREIGVRKVLGASILHIVILLWREFLRPVALAFLLAVPVAYYAAGEWLQVFAYREPVSALTIAEVGLLTFAVALATVSVQAARAALVNPVDSLRNE